MNGKPDFEIGITHNIDKEEEFEVNFEGEFLGYTSNLSDVRAIIEMEADNRGLEEDDYDIQYNY